MTSFKVGQKVKVRENSPCECAGVTGVVYAIRHATYHVKLVEGSDELRRTTFIGVFNEKDLEDVRN